MEGNEYKEVLQLYDKLEAENEKKKKAGVHDYSLINALLKASDEVNLHSKFIYSMINPAGLHYCEDVFLELFLKEINCEKFIDLEAAEVFREKGNIDLLIHDGNKFIIIENKLNAIDQEYQITRYIKYVKDRFLPYDDDLSDKIKIVYLAKNKSYPSNHSLIGFKRLEDENVVEWQGDSLDVTGLKGFTLNSGTKIPYIHINYHKNIQHWVSESRETDECKSKNLIHVFDEYELVLKRLNSKKPWRNIMGLSEYCFGLEEGKDGSDKDRLCQFMAESREALPKLISKEITNLFKKELDGDIAQCPFSNIVPEDKIIKPIKDNEFAHQIIKWLNETGYKENWKDIGVVLANEKGEYWCFIMRVAYIYFEQVELSSGGEVLKEKCFLKDHKISSREDLFKKNGLIDLKKKVRSILQDNFESHEERKK